MTESTEINLINDFIQKTLKDRNLSEVTAVDAASWLDEASLLKDTPTRPGKPLRDLLNKKKIKNALQRNATYWYILRGED